MGFEALERFPWGPGVRYDAIDDRNLPIQNILTTAPIGALPFIGCLQQDVPGIYNAKEGYTSSLGTRGGAVAGRGGGCAVAGARALEQNP